jgi:hypothetical protein
MTMGDLEENEARLCKLDEEAEAAESLSTPSVMQIMDHRGQGEIFSVDCTTVRTTGVEIYRHAGDTRKFFVQVTAKFNEWVSEDGYSNRSAWLNCVHREIGKDGMTFMEAKRFASKVIASNDYLNKDEWRFNV